MKKDYIAEADKSRIYPPGVALNGDGVDVCLISEAENCRLLLFKKVSRRPVARIPFPQEGRMGMAKPLRAQERQRHLSRCLFPTLPAQTCMCTQAHTQAHT